MADTVPQFTSATEDVTRTMYEAMQGIAGTELSLLQRLGEVEIDMFNQAFEAANEELQLISRVRNPRDFASAQADLTKRYGQRYVESVKHAVELIAEAWQEYGDRLDKTLHTATDKARPAATDKAPPAPTDKAQGAASDKAQPAASSKKTS